MIRPGSAGGVPSSPLRVLTWHVHGSYLNYLSQVPVTWPGLVGVLWRPTIWQP